MDVVLKGELPEEKNKIVRVDISKIEVNPFNDYRISDTDEGIQALANDIENTGLLHNLVVSKRENGRYIIISGERRFRALSYLFEKEVENKGDVAKYRTIPCRVVEGLTERQEMIMLDAANLQTRGGAGDEAHVRNAMIRYRDNTKAEYGLTERQAKDLLVQITPFSKSSVTSNLKIADHLRSELQEMLDRGEMTKRTANELVKLKQRHQKMLCDLVSKLKQSFFDDEERFALEREKLLEAFAEAAGKPTENQLEEAVMDAYNNVERVLLHNEELKLAQSRAEAEARKNQKENQNRLEKREAQRDVYLKKCSQIKKGLSTLSKRKTISRIKEFDASAEEDNRKVLAQIEEIIAMAQYLKDQLDGENNG